MATKKQIAANRRNAKKSTGPRTAEGKAVSARNGTKHGLLSRWPVLPEEDAEAFERMRDNLYNELLPLSQLERLIVTRLAAVQWRLARVPQLEAELFERLRADAAAERSREAQTALGHDEGLGAAWARDAGPYGGALARLARYETALERNAARLLAELRHLQAERRKDALLEAELARERGPWRERMEHAWPGAPTGASSPGPFSVYRRAEGASDPLPAKRGGQGGVAEGETVAASSRRPRPSGTGESASAAGSPPSPLERVAPPQAGRGEAPGNGSAPFRP